MESFLLESAVFDFEKTGQVTVSFLGPEADKRNTHITLIAGANGTSKSRLLASIVEELCDIYEQNNASKSNRRYPVAGSHGLRCAELTTVKNGKTSLISGVSTHLLPEITNASALPSRVLVLSNLVMDKFNFPKESGTENQFYHYLGVRQATNLTTTGSLERSVTEAVLTMAADQEKLSSFQSWVELVFSSGRELAFRFPRLKVSEINKFLNSNDKVEFVRERMQRRGGAFRATVNQHQRAAGNQFLFVDTAREVTELFEFLRAKIVDYQTPKLGKPQSEPLLRLATLSEKDAARLAEITPYFSSAQRAGFSSWPSLCLEANPWLSFNQLSSGEQNILSVGAKLIAYARPNCLIAIDEPEVSLNVAWQQHYTDLIRNSLTHAPGSHVLIATHSPHLIASLPMCNASVVMIEKAKESLSFKTVDARFEGWGSESVLYQVLGIPSASSFLFHRELAKVLAHIQNGGSDKNLIDSFLDIASKLDYAGIDPLEEVIAEIRAYGDTLN